MSSLEQHTEAIRSLCRLFHVERLEVFGSVAEGRDVAGSDVDLLVRFQKDHPQGAFLQYFGLKEELEALLGRPVDLVCRNAVRNAVFRDEVESTARPLYAA